MKTKITPTELAEMTPEQLAAVAGTITVIADHDADVQYPVYTEDVAKWVAANGELRDANEEFCDGVDMACTGLMTGSDEMYDLCQRLQDAGAAYISLPAV